MTARLVVASRRRNVRRWRVCDFHSFPPFWTMRAAAALEPARQMRQMQGDDGWSIFLPRRATGARMGWQRCLFSPWRRAPTPRMQAAQGRIGRRKLQRGHQAKKVGPDKMRRRRTSIASRRTPRPGTRSSCPAARCPSRRSPDRSACSTTIASRRPTSSTRLSSSTAPSGLRGPLPSSSMADRAPRRPGCSSATPGRGGCRSRARAPLPPQRPISCPMPRPGSISAISSSSIPSAPDTAVSSRPARRRGATSGRSKATSTRSRW